MELYRIPNRTTFGFSAENPTGAPNGGSRGKDCEKVRPCVLLEPGRELTICDAKGPGMITHIWLGGYSGHSFIMRIYYEEQSFPSVEAPISAFFGCAYDENWENTCGEYPVLNSAAILSAPSRGLNCYFEMPFRRRCRITMENRGEHAQYLFWTVTGWHGELPEDICYFHAVYRQEHPVQRGRAYTVLDGVEGKGSFLGMTLAAGMNGNSTCWVEGEVKMYIDGDQYPTVNYTGTEDYFCGSFAFGNDGSLNKYQPYNGLYAGLSAVMGCDRTKQYDAQQRFQLYRWHIKDPIYFHKSFRMTMDNLGWTGPRYDDYTTVAYWYCDKPSKTPFILPSDKEIIMK